MSDLADKVKGLHTVGLRGIKDILYKKGTFKKLPFWVSLLLSLGISVALLSVSPEKSFIYLRDSVELILSFFPSLLGFSLGGYALVVGFSNLDLIKAGSKTDKHSVYQILNAIFSLCIFLQVMTTLLSFLLSWIIKVNFFGLTSLQMGFTGDMANGCLLFFLMFCSLYSLALTPYVVTNLFTLSQINSSYLTIQKIRESKNKTEGKEVE